MSVSGEANPFEYQKVVIKGTLHTLSPLHIGSGDSEIMPEDESNTRVANVLRDAQGQPYLPASTLRGFLRDTCQRAGWDTDKLFGVSRQSAQSALKGAMGRLRVYDGRIREHTPPSDAPVPLEQVTRTSIDPCTDTALQHHLSTQQRVLSGTVFQIQLELDYCNHTDVTLLLAALAAFNRDSSRIGNGKNSGQGQLRWANQHVEAITLAAFKAWLQDGTRGHPPATQVLDVLAAPQAQRQPVIPEQWHKQSFHLQALSPILINDSALVSAEKHRAAAQEDHTPDLIFSGQAMCDGRLDQQAQLEALKTGRAPQQASPAAVPADTHLTALIPATTLKGWLRGHCRRILLTIAGGTQAAEQADQCLRQLFGGTEEGAGLLRFEDATARITTADCHEQTFNALDRFSGGVKDGALYTVLAVCPQAAFEGAVYYRKTAVLNEAMKLLLLFALRDAMNGDLVLGWGKAKGYGQLILKLADGTDWPTLQQPLGEYSDNAKGFAELQALLATRPTDRLTSELSP